MSYVNDFLYEAVDTVIEGKAVNSKALDLFGYSQVNSVPGNIVSSDGVVVAEIEIDYEVGSDEDITDLQHCILDTADAVAMEKAMRSGNDDLAMDLAEDAFDTGFDDWKELNRSVFNNKVESFKNFVLEEINSTEVILSGGHVVEIYSIEDLIQEDIENLVVIDVIKGYDTSNTIGDRAQFAFDTVMDSLESRGLLEVPLEDEE